MATTEKLVGKWYQTFKKATDFDSWGQLVEASDEYVKFSRQIRVSLNNMEWNEDQKKTLSRIASSAECRSKTLQSVDGKEDLRLEDMRRLHAVLKSIASATVEVIPTDVNARIERIRKRNAMTTPSPELTQVEDLEDEEVTFTSKFNTLLPKLPAIHGKSLVTVSIVKIGMKDAADYIDPYFVVSSKDKSGLDLCPAQNTPTSTSRDDTYLFFNVNVELQLALEDMIRGSAVFFEMRYFKQKRKTTVTKCFAFMEIDELKAGPCVIELYKKPLDYRRKKLTLLTSKPLYLHLGIIITSE
ncbi:axin interactor, dorsalization-associated protein-like [Clavelina lepadiformis]|uniref:C2 Aida-type domain-containing protein n=1 Tax=Clavelina lepadiformis TaxID=159417 RepID=A0ABP0GLT1_CLALP